MVAVSLVFHHSVDVVNSLCKKVGDDYQTSRSLSAINKDTEAVRVPNERGVPLSHINVSDSKDTGGRCLTASIAESERHMG